MKRVVRLALLGPALLLAGCLKSSLPELGVVPAFELTAQDGRAFQSSRELAGKVWVADFFYTTCMGPCPRMTALMRRVQGATAQFGDVRLVSFTVDPEVDTPAKLDEYARRFKADTSRWSFLTGSPQVLDRLGGDAFHLGGMGPEHGTRFALVDAKGRIRAYYETVDTSAMKQLVADIGALRKEVF